MTFLSGLARRLKAIARAADVRPYVPPAKPDPMIEVDKALAQEPPKPESLDRAVFFDRLREGPLRHRTPAQVAGTEAILDACAGLPISWVAYACATAWHETGGNMKPNVESLNYSVSGLLNTFGRHRISRSDAERLGRKPGEPALSLARQRAIANILYGGEWGRANLGNTMPDDGWTYRGRGMAHDTGRRNYRLSGEAVGIDLLTDPDALLDTATAARVMVTGMKTGRYTSHAFHTHLPQGEATAAQFGQARRIINGTDKAAQIAGHALLFQNALKAAGWQ